MKKVFLIFFLAFNAYCEDSSMEVAEQTEKFFSDNGRASRFSLGCDQIKIDFGFWI